MTSASTTYRGVTARVEIEDDPDENYPNVVVVRVIIDPPMRGLDRVAYIQHHKVTE